MQMQRKVYIINTELNPSELKFQAKNKAKKWLSVCCMCVCVCAPVGKYRVQIAQIMIQWVNFRRCGCSIWWCCMLLLFLPTNLGLKINMGLTASWMSDVVVCKCVCVLLSRSHRVCHLAYWFLLAVYNDWDMGNNIYCGTTGKWDFRCGLKQF